LALGSLEVGHQGDVARRRGLRQHVHQLPAVLPERVEDVPRVVREEWSHEVLPLLHQATSSRRCAFIMHTPMTTSNPASSAIRRASSETMSFCNHRTLAPTPTASRATAGVASTRRNT